MADNFLYDVFLSHSSRDKAIVRPIAERLRMNGLNVWFDEWIIRIGDSIPAKIEEGLEHSRVLVLCMSANAFSSDWAQLEAGTFRFRDPLNRARRFIPLRLDDAPLRGSLAQLLCIDWSLKEREQAYTRLLESCRPPEAPIAGVLQTEGVKDVQENWVALEPGWTYRTYAFSADGKRVLTSRERNDPNLNSSTPNLGPIQLWNMDTGQCLRAFKEVPSVPRAFEHIAWSPDERFVVGGSDSLAYLFDVGTGSLVRTFKGHTELVWDVQWSANGQQILSSSFDKTIRLWDVMTGHCLHVLEGHLERVRCIRWSPDQHFILSSSDDNTLRLWDAHTGKCLRVFAGHSYWVLSAAWSADQRIVLSGSCDRTIRLWDVETGRCLRILEGHTSNVEHIAWDPHQRYILSGSPDHSVRLWDVQTGECLRVLQGHDTHVRALMWSKHQPYAYSGDFQGVIRLWHIDKFNADTTAAEGRSGSLSGVANQVQYTNAKVLLVGESSAGKTGLSTRLALDEWRPSDSTVGAWATHWKLPLTAKDDAEREIWLWDFGGQADQRLIHQLYMDETALAVLVFDGQKEDMFDTLGQWDRDLARTSEKTFPKLLVAGRVDAGGLRVSRSQIEIFRQERGYLDFIETSAKTGLNCEKLRRAIFDGIRWEDIPWRSSPHLFKRLKEAILQLKDAGRVLFRFNELREALQLSLAVEHVRFTDEELKAVIGLLAGPGVVWELRFGSWLLLQPERINAYAQAVIQTIREDENERGCLQEEIVLGGELTYHRPHERLHSDEERIVLLAMHQILVERGLCLREHTDKGTMLIFPSYYRRERPDLSGHPAALVSYSFSGFLDEVYATLVVRLHHTRSFVQDQLWRYAADFKTLTGKQLGVKLERRGEGAGELLIYADPTIADSEKIIFSRYVHEHILQKGQDMVRLRHYVCPHCGTPVGNREVAMKRLNEWIDRTPTKLGLAGKIMNHVPDSPTIVCANCENRVPLWDELEQHFASDELKKRVRLLQIESDIKLDNESKDRALVGEVISTVALAGQISREFSVSDHGIDMEIEFKNDINEATGKKLYLQLKSGDSHLRNRKSDGAEVFDIANERHIHYWLSQAFPVFLVIANAKGEVRWMEISNYLRHESENGKKSIRQIVFKGERFDVVSVRLWREKALGTIRN